ncbi:protein mono-ADP-ribosyltransferase PARP14-like isoform X2 [Hyperolius riggenbachi]|uniref:protein mono-ADP-ribosyltransferase PARP14-like isoform X2 n=1 Tax=Hyperolius riggenbachi TaxID=752182 RepID=UPI0035A31512
MEESVRSATPTATGATASYTSRSRRDSQSGPSEDKVMEDDAMTQEDPPSSLVLIENLQDSCTPEILNLLVENISDKIEEIDFYVEMLPEIRAAVVTFTCDVDVPGFIKAFSSSIRVRHHKLTVKAIEASRSVRAEHLPEDTSEEHLKAYMESTIQGRGGVEEVVIMPEERAALVTFDNMGAVRTVLKMEHVFGKTRISVFPYYPLLGVTLYGRRGPCIEIPKPIEFPISPYILEYIMNDGDLKLSMEEKMKSKHCEIIWPDLGSQNPVLKLVFPPALSTQLRTMTKVLLHWNEEAYSAFSPLISQFKAIECKMHQLAWEVIRDQTKSPPYNRVLVKPDFSAEKVFLVGLSKDVSELYATFRKLVEETSRQIERKTQSVTEDIAMSSALFQMMCNKGLKRKIQEQVPELKIDYDLPTKKARFSGLRDEVLTAKCEILSIKQQLKSKSIWINRHLIEFLMSTDNEELSEQIFLHNNINALMETEDNSVKLTAYTKEDLTEAEKQIRQKLSCRLTHVDNKRLLRCPEWESLHSYLLEAFNVEKCSVLILECPPGAPDDVVIAGLSSVVQDCYQQVNDFMERNATIEREIPVTSTAVMQFIQEERREMWKKLQDDVIVIKNQNSICLSGPRMQVQEASSLLQSMISSLHYDTLHVDKPGVRHFCRKNEDIFVAAAKAKFSCVICLEVERDNDLLNRPRFQINLPNRITIAVYKEDLCRHRVDVVVNAANEDLDHIGGLARAIVQAAGQKLKDDCDCIIKRDGRLSSGDAVITDAGNLPCKQVIHTVGPRWNSTSTVECELLLRKAITNSLQLAAAKGHTSIAIPAVSSGVFGFPLKSCLENIVEAIREYAETQGGKSTLQRIHLVDSKEETVNMFCEVSKAKFGHQNNKEASATPAPQPGIEEAESVQVMSGDANTLRTKEGLIIRLVQKNIEDCTTDVIVNSVNLKVDMNFGVISRALLSRAGAAMQQLLTDASVGDQVTLGSVYVTSGCSLSCKEVFHVVTPQWDNGQGMSEKIFREFITSCLKQAEQKGWRSISFPAIGTGNLGFPRTLVASLMVEEALQFSHENKVQNLQEVHLVLHPSDQTTIQAFSDHLARYTDGVTKESTKTPAAVAGPAFFGTVTSPSQEVYEMKIGSLTYQVKSGDITKETADVIVNSTNAKFNLHSGVSKAILKAAGKDVALSAATLGAQPHNGFITTHPGKLKQCKFLLHVTGDKQQTLMKYLVLQECERNGVSSVAFPAMGTGVGGLSASAVAESFLDAMVDFINSKPTHSLQTVKVVLFQQQMLNDFYTSMKRREGTALPDSAPSTSRETGFSSPQKVEKPVQKLSAFQLVEGIEPVIFSLCAEDQENVDQTKAWLQKQIDCDQAEKVIKDECISELEDTEMQKICDLQKQFQVSVIYQPPDLSIKILGLTRDVMVVSSEIETIINRAKDRKIRERSAELTSKLVEWRYKHGGNMVAFDKMINLELEEAKYGNQPQITVQSHGKLITVNLLTVQAKDQHGNQVQIERAVRHEENSLRLPGHWSAMNQQLVIEVDVMPGTPEYLRVQQKFNTSCNNPIIMILRVQNKDLWRNYQIKKQNIEAKNGFTNNERELFHGTDFNSVQHVKHNGFNRSYAGRHAASFGHGTYFAVNASYSANATYSKPDGNGLKHMYLARVLTGKYCAGHTGMIVPPPKNPANPTDLYDSVTDNVQNPSMFVIFHDIQAYPEYHIVFQ